MSKITKTFTTLATGKLSKTPMWIFEIYGGDVVIEFMPNSHRYKIVKIKGKSEKEIERINSEKTSGTSSPGMIDKSRMLIPWAVRLYTKKVLEQMGEDDNFTADDIKSMLAVGEKAHSQRLKEAGNIGTIVHRYAELFGRFAIDKKLIQDKKTGEYDLNAEILSEIFEVLKSEFENDFEDWKETWEKSLKGIDAFNNWVQEYKPVFKNTERLVYSIKNNHLGLYDVDFELMEKWVGKELAGLYLNDHKTANGIYDEHYYQLSSYLKAVEEEQKYLKQPLKYKGGTISAFFKEDKFNKDGELIQRAGDYKFILRTREELISDYKVYKACQVIEIAKKASEKKRRELQKELNKK